MFYGSEAILHDTVMVGSCHYAFVQTYGMNHSVNYVLWVLIMCQYRFISCSKCTTLVRDVDNGGGSASMEGEGLWETSVPSPEFHREP